MLDQPTLSVNAHTRAVVQRPAPFTPAKKLGFLLNLIAVGAWIFDLFDLPFIDGEPTCPCGAGAGCPNKGKHPKGKWSLLGNPKHKQTRKRLKHVLRRWADRGFGIHLGKSGWCVLDIDKKHGGLESLKELQRKWGIDLGEPHVHTGGGGMHYYFLAPAGVDAIKGFIGANHSSRCSLLLAPGVEIFFGQHFVVLPFSPHASGGWYTLGSTCLPGPMPAELLKMVCEHDIFAVQPTAAATIGGTPPGAVPVPPSAATIDLQDRIRCARTWLGKLNPAIEGEHGKRRTWYAARVLLKDFELPLEIAWSLLQGYNLRCIPPWVNDELYQMLVDADALPRSHAPKLRETAYKGRRRPAEDLAFLDDLQVDIHLGDYKLHLGGPMSGSISPVPRKPAITQEELDSIKSEPDRCITMDTMPEPTEDHGPTCICSFLILLGDPKTGRFRVVRMPGRRWDCPVCGPKRREHYRATIRHHLRECAEKNGGMNAPKLWIATIGADIWRRVGSSLRIKHAQFFRIGHNAMGKMKSETFLVVSTERTNHCEWELISVQAASDQLCGAIDALPCDLHVRVWWSSKQWLLLKDRPKKEPEFKRLGRLKSSWASIKEVLEAWHLKIIPIRGHGRFWDWSGSQFQCPVSKYEDLRRDLDDGCPTSKLAPYLDAFAAESSASEFADLAGATSG